MLNATVVALTWMAQICGIYFIPNYPDVGPLVNAGKAKWLDHLVRRPTIE